MHAAEIALPATVASQASANQSTRDGAAPSLVTSMGMTGAARDTSPADPGPRPQPTYPVVDGFITVAREELYRRVWSEPMRTLAPQFGLSDVGLAKVCKRHAIPRPPVGYWAKKQFGKRVKKTALPRLLDPSLQTIKIRHAERQSGDSAVETTPGPLAQDPEIAALIEQEYAPQNQVSVPQTLRAPHPLVENIRVALSGSKMDEYDLLHPRWISDVVLIMAVTKESLNRALRIADTLLKALDARGHKVKEVRCDGGRRSKLDVLGEEVIFRLREKVNRSERSTAEREKARSWARYDYVPSGLLELKLELREAPMERSWVDSKRTKLEDRVQDILLGLLTLIDEVRAWRKELEEWTRAYREKERQKLEDERRARAQQAARDELEKLAAAWSRSRRLRDFVAAVRAEADRRGEDLSANHSLAAWIASAEQLAHSLDPFAQGRPLPQCPNTETVLPGPDASDHATQDVHAWSPPRHPR